MLFGGVSWCHQLIMRIVIVWLTSKLFTYCIDNICIDLWNIKQSNFTKDVITDLSSLGILPTLSDQEDYVKHRLAQLFEKWWYQELESKEDIIPNAFIYLLERSLHPKGTVCLKNVDHFSCLYALWVLPLILFGWNFFCLQVLFLFF